MSVYQELLRKLQPAKSGVAHSLEDAVHLSTVYRSAADVYRRARQADLADALDAKRRDLWRQWDSMLPDNAFVRRQLQAASLP
jgi:hypothetical protein